MEKMCQIVEISQDFVENKGLTVSCADAHLYMHVYIWLGKLQEFIWALQHFLLTQGSFLVTLLSCKEYRVVICNQNLSSLRFYIY